ncbi:MAG: transcription termination/antitermination protein NusA, partial [Elusimicrobiota bacterium]
AIIPQKEQVFSERFRVGDHIKVLIVSIEKSLRGPKILVSRRRTELVKKLFELEVPEIYEKVIEVKKVVREPGIRSKVVVYSSNPKIDPIGSCVGVKGSRVKPIIDELRGERIDLVLYSEDIVKYITSAFSPAKILRVNLIDPEKKHAMVIVSDDMLSLAIGKRGTNVNLVGRITDWRIDVRSETQVKEMAQKQAVQSVEELSKIKGVGEKIADTLFKAGWRSIEKLANAKTEELTSLQGIGEKKAEKIINEAKKCLQTKEIKEKTREEKTVPEKAPEKNKKDAHEN